MRKRDEAPPARGESEAKTSIEIHTTMRYVCSAIHITWSVATTSHREPG